MSISIVIVTFNSSNKISKLLDSLDKQVDIRGFEVIVIDNNSPDQHKLKDILGNNHKQRSYRLVVKYRSINCGFGKSCNYGARIANRGLLLFLNPDTELYPRTLSILMKHFVSSEADILGGKSLHYKSKIVHQTVFNKPTIATMLFEFSNLGKIFRKSGNFYLKQNDIKKDIVVDGVGGAFLLCKKNIFQKLRGFDESIFMYLEDVDFCVRAATKKYKIVYCPHSIINHEGGASSDNKYHIVHKAWHNSREYYLIKNFNSLVSIPIFIWYRIERIILGVRTLLIQQ